MLLAYTDDMNLLGCSTDAKKKNTDTLSDASKEAGLEINVAISSRNIGQNRDKK
jgi:hypothetical protein